MPTKNNVKLNYGRYLNLDHVVGRVPPPKPALITWSRLEPLPYSEDLKEGLQAQIADPLWMIARQWQFSEFQGEDAGSPIWSKLDSEMAVLQRYQADKDKPAVDFDQTDIPLEVVVEQEEIRSLHPRLAAEAGEHFIRLLTTAGLDNNNARQLLRQVIPLDISAQDIWAQEADSKGMLWQSLFALRAVDGVKLASLFEQASNADNTITQIPADLSDLAAINSQAVLKSANTWLSWYHSHIHEPAKDDQQAWVKERQEYSFKMSARLQNEEITVTSDEYADGKLDWYSFKIEKNTPLGPPAKKIQLPEETIRPVLPTPVRYAGMPADRYWEFEDARVNLGYLDAGPTDLGRLLLAEFGLVYSNDWFLIPVELPVGAIFHTKSLQVKDTFGEIIDIKPSRNFNGTRWSLFSLTEADSLPSSLRDFFFLPPSLSTRFEGDPIEEVSFFRDEMANLSWAQEHKVQGASGLPLDRKMEPPSFNTFQRIDTQTIHTDLIYRLMTPVADSWQPFVPVKNSQSFSPILERRTLLKTLVDGSEEEVHPRGHILRTDLSLPVEDEPPLSICDEEIHESGINVKRSFQYTRWVDGSRHLWVGRSKGIKQNKEVSGLKFDMAVSTQLKNAPLLSKRQQVNYGYKLKL